MKEMYNNIDDIENWFTLACKMIFWMAFLYGDFFLVENNCYHFILNKEE